MLLKIFLTDIVFLIVMSMIWAIGGDGKGGIVWGIVAIIMLIAIVAIPVLAVIGIWSKQ